MTTEEELIKKIGIDITVNKVQIGAHEINYVTAGSGPPLVMVHGANFGWGVWYDNIAELSKHFTIYALDLPGAGRSSGLDYKNLDPHRDFVEVLAGFIDSLGIRDVSLIGHSIGAWAALQWALRRPDLVKKLVLSGSVGFSSEANLAEKIFSIHPIAKAVTGTVLRPHRKNKRLEMFLRSGFHSPTTEVPLEFLNYFYETMERSHGLLLVSGLIRLRESMFLPNGLGELRDKSLLLWGEHDSIIPINRITAQPLIIANAGHVPFIEQRDLFNSTVLKFLNDTDTSS